MITQKKIAIGAARRMAKYQRDATALEHADRQLGAYYGGWDARGTWRRDMAPGIAMALGINPTQTPTEDQLTRLFEAKRADNGERWTREKREISAVDLQAAPDKTVTMAVVRAKSPAERASLLQAIWRANAYAIKAFVNRLAVARTGQGGSGEPIGGDAGWCSFMHFTARPTFPLQDGPTGKTEIRSSSTVPSDPQIHIHNPTFNLVHCDDGKLRALDFGQIRHIKEFGALFQQKLADELRALGVRVHANADGTAIVVDAIPQAIAQHFSKGRDGVIARAKAAARQAGLDWDDLSQDSKHDMLNQAAGRKIAKQDGQSDQQRWDAECDALGWHHTTVLTNEPPLHLTKEQWQDQAYAFTARHLAKEFETAAVIDLEVMRHWAARSLIGIGSRDPSDVNAVVQLVLDRGITFDGRDSRLILGQSRRRIRVTHTVQVEIEQAVQAMARSMGQDNSRALSQAAADAAIASFAAQFTGTIGDQQRDATLAMMRGPALVYLEGVAGTGKTSRVLPPCVEAWQADGRHVIGLSQAWRQTDDLADAGIAERYALSPFLAGIKNGTIEVSSNTVLVLDETAQVGPKTFLELQRLWMKYGVVVRAMGDREQAQSIEAASAAQLIARPDFNGEATLPPSALPKIEETVRQKTPDLRHIATQFRNGGTAEAIAAKRADGTARLVGGDYDQVVARIAARYLELRDMAAEKRWQRGVAIYTLTNADAAAISRHVRERLQARGEVARDEIVYQAVDNRGVQYDLPVAVGDRHRLFKKTFGLVGDDYRSVGSNGDTVEIMGYWDSGLVLKTKTGEVARVRWSSLKDAETDRLKLGYGHCLTIDAAQGLTASATIHALPRGSIGETAFKAYVGESRHEDYCETLIAEAAMRAAVQQTRPLGDDREITDEDLWQRVVKDMADKPTKALALDLLDQVRDHREALVDDLLRLDRRLQAAEGRDYAEEINRKLAEINIHNALEPQVSALESVIASRTQIIEGLRDHMADTLRDLREAYLQDDPGPDLSWFNRPSVAPGL